MGVDDDQELVVYSDNFRRQVISNFGLSFLLTKPGARPVKSYLGLIQELTSLCYD